MNDEKPLDGLEKNLEIIDDDDGMNDLPCYIINPDNLFYKF